MVLGRYSIDKDVETTVGTAGASSEICVCTGYMGDFPEAQSGPQGRSAESDVAPMVADVGDGELKLC